MLGLFNIALALSSLPHGGNGLGRDWVFVRLFGPHSIYCYDCVLCSMFTLNKFK